MTDERELVEETILQLASVLREKTYAKHVLSRESYQKKMQDTCEADRAYMMLDLTDQQRKIIDDMLDKREAASGRELTWSYLMGMLDAVMFLRKTGFLDMFLWEEENEE